jgi:hypothetical protein
MTDRMRDGIAEALRLTLAGRLNEATATIQRTLGGSAAQKVPQDAPRTTGHSMPRVEARAAAPAPARPTI